MLAANMAVSKVAMMIIRHSDHQSPVAHELISHHIVLHNAGGQCCSACRLLISVVLREAAAD